MAHRPLHSTQALAAVQRASQTVLRAMRDQVIDLAEYREIRAALSDAEGATRHADNCGRYAMAILRDTGTPQYLDELRMKAGAPEFEPLDAA